MAFWSSAVSAFSSASSAESVELGEPPFCLQFGGAFVWNSQHIFDDPAPCNGKTASIQDYAKLKGYTAILDIDKLAQAGVIMFLDPTASITKEFITYYNQKAPATATTAS